MALVSAILTLFFCLFVFGGQTQLFRDADSGWHIRNGERILAAGAVPYSDPFSFSKPGEPWFAWEWGADVMMGALHRTGGMRAIFLFFAMLIAAATWLWIRLNWACGGNFLLACLLLFPMITTSSLHWLARPHVPGWLFLLAALLAAEQAPIRFRPWHAAALALGGAAWANVHGSFFLAPLVFLLYALGLFLRPLIWPTDYFLDGQRASWLIRAAGVTALASVLNPYGWQLHLHVFRYLSDTELLARIAEFQSFNFHAEGALQVLLTVLLCGAGAAAALAARQPGRFLVTLFFTVIALRSARGLPVAALAVLPLANGSLTAALTAWPGLRDRSRAALDAALLYGQRLRALDAGFHGAALLPQVLLAAWLATALPGQRLQTGFDPREFPVEAAEFVARLPREARLFSTDKFGGYLIYRFAGERKVYFDGRSDFYGAAFLKRYIRMVEVKPGWQDLWREGRFSHALVARDSALGAALETRGWRRLHADATALLLEAPQEPLG